MAFELPTMPNFNTQPVTMPSPLDQYGKMLQLKTLQGQQALIPGQLQEQQERVKQEQIQTQQLQQQQQSQAAMIKAWSDPAFASTVTGGTGKDIAPSIGFTPGFDPNAMIKSLVSKGVLPKDAMAQAASFLELSKNLSLKTKDDLSNYKEAHQQLANLLAPITSMKVEDAGPALDAVKQKVASGGIPGLDSRDVQLMQQADLTHLAPVLNLLGLASSVADFHKGQSEATKAATEAITAQQKVIDPKLGMSPEQAAEGNKEVAVAKAEQPLKIQTAQAEAQAAQLIKGMEQPVYAFKPDGSKELMSATTALQSGLKTMLPVTAKEIGEDTMLINRLGDVRQKITRYEQAMQKPIDQPDRAAIASLISSDHFKPGIFGFTMTLDTLKNLSKQADIKVLSPEARDRLVAYYNARESLTGYNRVLSGTGKSSEKNMELQLDTLADPAASDQDYAARSFRDFRENLGVVGQGLPKIPGVKSPEEIEAQVAPPTTATAKQPAQKKTKASKYGVEIQ